jgi:hypothetical protein
MLILKLLESSSLKGDKRLDRNRRMVLHTMRPVFNWYDLPKAHITSEAELKMDNCFGITSVKT